MIFTISVIIFGCSNNIVSTEEKILDTIVIDESTNKTITSNSEFKVRMTAKTEKVDYVDSSYQNIYDGNITYYTYSQENKEDITS